jgi:fatty acid desaturase
MIARLFRSPHGALVNAVALAYTLGGYAAGVALLTAEPWWANALGVLLTAHALVYAAYFIHEFAHQAVFRSPAANNAWGEVMSWIAGACYAPFSPLRRKHMRHHIDRADVLTFDYKAFLRRSPPWVTKLVLALEWAYIPAVEFIMHGYVMLLPFLKQERRAERPRLMAIVAVRVAAFATLGSYSLKALLLYAVAYMIMLHVLRFTDAFQHTYDAFAVLEGGEIPSDKLRDRDYEQANTYSNLVSVAHPWLNLLLLNFSYHNAHHERPIEPWHDLPRLHAQLFPGEYVQVIPMRQLLRGYHRDRLARIVSDDYGEVGQGPGKADGFLGAVGVSFLTAV